MLFGKISSGTDAVVRTEAPYTATEGVGTDRGPIDAVGPRPGPPGRRRPRGRGLGQRLRAADRQRRPGDHHQRWRADQRLQHAGRRASSAATSSCSSGTPRRHRTRSPSTPPAPTTTTSRSARRSRCCSRVRPRSSPSSAPSGTATASTTSAAPRRRTSTPRPRSGCSARPGSSTASTSAPSRGVCQTELADRLSAVLPAGHRGGHRRGRRRGERRRDQVELQDRRHPLRDLRRHRAVRRLVHHLEHLHDDRHPAVARDRAAAGDRRPSPPGPRQPAARGPRARAASPPRPGSGSASRVAKGLKGLMDAVGLALPFTSLQVEPARSGSRSLVGTGVTVVAALVPARRATKVLPIEALRESTPGAEKPSRRRAVVGAGRPRRRCGRPAVGAVRRRRHEGVRARAAGRHGRRDRRAAVRGAAAGCGDRGAAAAARPAGRAGQAERDPQPAPYLGHGGGPDDRPDPGRQHGRVRLLAEGVVRRRPRRPDRRRPVRRHLERPGAGLQPVRAGRGARTWTASTRSRPTAGARPASTAQTSSYSSIDPANAEDVINLDVSQGSLADLGKDGVVVAKSAAKLHGWNVGDTVTAEFAAEREAPAARGRHLRGQGLDRRRLRRSASPSRTPSPARSWSSTALVTIDGCRPGAGPGRDRGGPGRPPGRQGARPGRLREGGQRVHRPAAHLHDRDAGPGRADRPARHRQHPGAVGLRAHPRARVCSARSA